MIMDNIATDRRVLPRLHEGQYSYVLDLLVVVKIIRFIDNIMIMDKMTYWQVQLPEGQYSYVLDLLVVVNIIII